MHVRQLIVARPREALGEALRGRRPRPCRPALITCSKLCAGRARRRQPASAPSRGAEMTVPARARDRVHVEGDDAARGDACGGIHGLRIGDRLAGLLLLGHGIGAVGGGDEQGPVRRHQAAQDGAARLHEFRRDHHVDVARRRHQRQDGRLAAAAAAAFRCSRSWRRCAGRRPERRSTGHASHWPPPPRRSSPSARRRPARPWRGWRWRSASPRDAGVEHQAARPREQDAALLAPPLQEGNDGTCAAAP